MPGKDFSNRMDGEVTSEMQNRIPASSVTGRNRKVVSICLGVVFGMVGLAYASVPLYRLFCQVTGYGGTTQVSTVQSEDILDETLIIRFDANVANDLGWSFRPEQVSMTVKIGETNIANYQAQNRQSVRTAGTAVFNVTPVWTGVYFYKIECFCFTEQVLAPGESAQMPVEFYVDPEIVNDPSYVGLSAITLSYTFFPKEIEAPAQVSSSDLETESSDRI
jgi:cytochrome c oxidase assembly protein subunit 11